MAERRIEHIYNCSETLFWEKVFLDTDYNRKLYVDHFGFESWELVKNEPQGAAFARTVQAVPAVPDLPGPLKRLARDGVGYTEHGIYSPEERCYRLTVTPQSLANKLDIRGELRTEVLGDNQCRRIYRGTVVAKIFGVGGLLETRILDDIEKSYRQSAEYTNDWLRSNPQ